MKKRFARVFVAACMAMQLVPVSAFGEIAGEATGSADQVVAANVDARSDGEVVKGGDLQGQSASHADASVTAVEADEAASASGKQSAGGGQKANADADADADADSAKAPRTVAAKSAKAASTNVEVTNFAMKWLPEKSTGATVSEDGKTLTINATTPSNAGTAAMAQYDITFNSPGQNDEIPAGAIEIRVPAHVFKDREGNTIMTPVSKKVSGVSVTEPSGPQAPATGTENAFNWTYNKETDEIVYTNFKAMSARAGVTLRVQYQISSLQVASGAEADVAGARYSVDTGEGSDNLSGKTDGLSAVVNTSVSAPSASKAVADKFETWQDAWGEQPAGVSDKDYYYVVWKMTARVSQLPTQPYRLIFDETTETNKKNTAADTDLVAWTTGSSSTWVQEYEGKTGAEGMKADPVLVTSEDAPGFSGGYSTSDRTRMVVYKYPRTNITDDNPSPKSGNGFTAVVEGIDGSKEQKAAFTSYVYQHVGVEYGGNGWATGKTALTSYNPATQNSSFYKKYNCQGGLSVLRNGNSYTPPTWRIWIENHQANLDAEGKPIVGDDAKDYGTVLRDGLMFIDGNQLTGGEDYVIKSFGMPQFDESDFEIDPNKGLYYKPNEDYSKYHEIKVLVRTAGSSDWHREGEIKRTGANELTFNGKTYPMLSSGGAALTPNIPLPEGTYDIKFEHMGNQSKVEYSATLNYELRPTDHVMQLVGDDTTQFDLFNIDDAYVTDGEGKIISGGNKPTSNTTSGIKAGIEASDKAEYENAPKVDGAGVVHDYSSHVYNAFKGSSSFSKSMNLKKEENGFERIEVSMSFDDYFNFSGKGLSKEEAIALGVINEQRSGTFYDLLPAGTTVDLSTLRVAPYGGSLTGNFTNVDGKTVKSSTYEYTVEMVNNWRGTGQTMMIVNVKAPEDIRNFNNSATYVDSGFQCRFEIIDTFDNIAANGGKLQNGAAYVSDDGSVSNGRPDDGTGSTNPDAFKGLASGGGDSASSANCKYAKTSLTVNPTLGAEQSFKKLVKNADEAFYKESTTVPASGSYSYQLMVKNDTNTRQSGIVMVDVLETAYGDNAYWQGKLTGIDMSQARLLGADPVAYWSERTEGLGQLTDETVWHKWDEANPPDMAKVKAVAFDCSKASATADAKHKDSTGGFVLPQEETLSCYLYMKAPDNYQDYEPSKIKAHNMAGLDAVRYAADDGEGQGTNSHMESESTKVDITAPNIKLEKASDPASGSESKPAGVKANAPLTYTLNVTNTGLAEAIAGVVVEDGIPDGLTVDLANVKYYYGGQSDRAALCDGTGRVSVEQTGQKLVFKADKVAAREVLHLVIPTTVSAVDANKQTAFVNQAKVTGLNGSDGWDVTSNKTYHQGEAEKTSVKVRKVWNDNNNAYGKRMDVAVKLQADGVDVAGGTHTLKAVEAVPTDANAWEYEFKDLPKFRTSDGQTPIVYTAVEETDVPGYDAAYSTGANGELVVTNTARVSGSNKASFKIKKLRENSTVTVPGTTFKLYKDETCTDANELTEAVTDANGVATVNFAPESENDQAYDVWLKETAAPDGYTVSGTPVKVHVEKADGFDTGDVEEGSIVIEYKWKVSVADNAGWNAASNTLTLNNAYAPKAAKLEIPVSKTLAGASRPSEKKFTFNLAANNNAPMPAAGGQTVTVTGPTVLANAARFGEITFDKEGVYSYTVSETKGSEPGYTYQVAPRAVEVVVADNGGYLNATWKIDGVPADDTSAVNFTNAYAPQATKMPLRVSKAILVEPGIAAPSDDEFSFTLTAVGGAPLPALEADRTATVTGESSAAFGDIVFAKAGDYTYGIREVNGGLPGYTYASGSKRITVRVTDNNGKLEAKWTADKPDSASAVWNDGSDAAKTVAFENRYKPAPVAFSLPVKKIVTGHDRPTQKDFEFTIEADGSNPDAPMPQADEGEDDIELSAISPDDGDGSGNDDQCNTVTVTDSGTASFNKITFERPGTYLYKVKETDGGQHGYTYDETVHTVAVKVTDNNGVLEAEWTEDDPASDDAVWHDCAATDTFVAFTNSYTPDSVKVALPMKKNVAGADVPGYHQETFEFDLAAKGGAPAPAGGNSITVEGAGEKSFGEITFEKADSYFYEVTEAKESNADKKKGYIYDQTKHSVEVAVTDTEGVLSAKVLIDGKPLDAGKSVEYTNTYDPAAAVLELPVAKAIAGNARSDKFLKGFEFKLVPREGNKVLADETGKVSYDKTYTTTVTDTGAATLGQIPVKKIGDGTGTLVYDLVETAGGAHGYTYDATNYVLKVTTEDKGGYYEATCKLYKNEGDADPMEQWTCNNDGVVGAPDAVAPTTTFSNAYDPDDATLQLPVTKFVTGDARPVQKSFEFTLQGEGDAPMPANGGSVVKVKGSDDDKGSTANFGTITFTKAGEYRYSVSETGTAPMGYTYDETVRHVTVAVEDNDGVLEATWKDDADDTATSLKFTNAYKPEKTSFAIPVRKSVEGNDRQDDLRKTFEFTLTAVDGAPVPADATGLAAAVKDESAGEFGEIEFTTAGTYFYQVRETNGGERGYTYDDSVVDVAVKVVDNDGELVASLTDGANGIDAASFTNTYDPADATFAIPVAKAFTGNDRPSEKEFSFTLEGVGDAPMPQKAAASGDGGNNIDLAALNGEDADESDAGNDGNGQGGDADDQGQELPTVTVTGPNAATFDEITFTKAGTYTYKVSEKKGSEPGYTYDETVREVVVTVMDNNGVLEASAETDGKAVTAAAPVTFTNDYAPKHAQLTLPVSKAITGNERTSGTKDFEFTLTAGEAKSPDADVCPMPEGDGNVAVVNDEGDATFGQIDFVAAGTYTYTVIETDAGETGYTYADPQTVTVKVIDNNGVLEASAKVGDQTVDADNPVAFTNNYAPTAAEFAIPVAKAFTGNDRPSEKDFQFTLEGSDGAPMPQAAAADKAGDGDADGDADDNGGDSGIDLAALSVDDADGSDAGDQGDDQSGDAGDEPQALPTVTITGPGAASFDKIVFDKAGTYTHTVTEVDGGQKGYTYAEPQTVTVTVVDNDGVLEASAEVGGKAITAKAPVTFTNAYAPKAASVAFPVEKVVEGAAPKKAETYTFDLAAATKGAPLPKSTSVKVKGAGKATFGQIEFAEAGTFEYVLSERAGDNKLCAYDTAKRKVVVKVTDNDGELSATWTVDGEEVPSAVFTNAYSEADNDGDGGNGNDAGDGADGANGQGQEGEGSASSGGNAAGGSNGSNGASASASATSAANGGNGAGASGGSGAGTGDAAGLLGWVALLAAAAVATGTVLVVRRRRKPAHRR